MILKTGDIIFTAKDSIIAKFMDLFQKDPVRWGHCLVVRDNRYAYEAKKMVSLVPLDTVFGRKTAKKYMVIRYKNLTYEHQISIIESCDSILGKLYSFKRIFLQFFDHLFNTNKFTRMDKSYESQVCSSLVAWTYWNAMKMKFNNLGWYSCEPDDIEDHYINNKEQWILVEEK